MVVTNEIRRFLELHALELQDNKISIANYYLMNYEKYIKVLNFLNYYIKTIEKYIDIVNIKAGDNIAPFVIIGSLVEIQESLTETKRTILISELIAEQEAMNGGVEKISFLSTLGKSLLFKEVGETITMEENDSKIRIERILYNLNL